MSEIEALLAKCKAEAKAERPRRVLARPAGFGFSNYRERNCSRCGRQFFSTGYVDYCSNQCQQADRNERRREQRAQERASRRREPGKCVVCGTKLVDQVRSTLRYCSDACRQQAYRSRAAP
jgi:endogenous inhibitor of DNA gyrase (YacG/DUF329 family)